MRKLIPAVFVAAMVVATYVAVAFAAGERGW
jgi:hypothetical protein